MATNMDQLLTEMRKCVRDALETTVRTAKAAGDDIMTDFYNSPQPKKYQRTGRFGRSLRNTEVGGSGNDYTGSIYRDVNYTYDQGFPPPDADGSSPYNGVVPAQDVHEWAEEHSHGILGKPATWARTLEQIEHEIEINFGAYFKK